MTQAEFVTLLKASLLDSQSFFTAAADADFVRHSDHAINALSRHAGRRKIDTITLVADQLSYTKPADLISVGNLLWGSKERSKYKPWEALWPGRLPKIMLLNNAVALAPPPTSEQINALGSSCDYTYTAAYVWSDDPLAATNAVPSELDDVLVLRAQAEAMKELAMRNTGKPVQIRGAGGATTRRDTPAALYNELMSKFFGELHGTDIRAH